MKSESAPAVEQYEAKVAHVEKVLMPERHESRLAQGWTEQFGDTKRMGGGDDIDGKALGGPYRESFWDGTKRRASRFLRFGVPFIFLALAGYIILPAAFGVATSGVLVGAVVALLVAAGIWGVVALLVAAGIWGMVADFIHKKIGGS